MQKRYVAVAIIVASIVAICMSLTPTSNETRDMIDIDTTPETIMTIDEKATIVENIDSLKELAGSSTISDLVYLTPNVVNSVTPVEFAYLETVIRSGSVVLMEGSLKLLDSTKISHAYDPNSTYSAIMFDEKGTSHCFSSSSTGQQLKSELETWMQSISAESDDTPVSTVT